MMLIRCMIVVIWKQLLFAYVYGSKKLVEQNEDFLNSPKIEEESFVGKILKK